MAVQVGDRAPNFTLSTQNGESVTLADLYSQKPVVLFFYPKDNTPGCTKEACGFRDSYSAFQDLGAEVVGISGDTVQSHQSFANSFQLPFLLLSDAGNKVRKDFGVPSTLGLLPGRVSYVIDQQGVVRHIFNSQFNFQGHIDEAIQALKSL
jgi:thioredoxin-dependent peroxiredoxin